ncbi:MAG: biotin/lipoyl-containing protein, partial [Deltaproteobacteria bacterium]
MAVELKVPSLGESVTQAQVGQWLKKEGDAVLRDEPVVEVESEKATVAVPAPASGVLRRVLRQTGEMVAVGQPLGEIEEGAVAAAAPKVETPPPAA